MAPLRVARYHFLIMIDQPIDITRLGPDGVELVQWTLYEAISWTGDPDIPPLDVAIRHPDLRRYHERWGRPGDFGVQAMSGNEFLGAAFARCFTREDHGHGFIDEETPELGIAVVPDRRGLGLGRRLMDELAEVARSLGFERLSLSVNNPNSAKRLYEALGYRIVEDDGDSSLMVLAL